MMDKFLYLFLAKMKAMKLKPQLVALAFFTALSVSCGGNTGGSDENTDPNDLTKIEGGKFQGGVLRLNAFENYTSLFPPAINDVYSNHIAGNVYEGLFRFDQATLETKPALAESFEIDNSKLIYTFNIRKGVMFHDDDCFSGGKGRELVAKDFKYSLEYVCSKDENNKSSTLFSDVIVGVNAFQAGEAEEVTGIKVLDKYQLEITLEDPLASLTDMLAVLATAVFPEEAVETYGYDGLKDHMVGTGPFIASNIENGKNVHFNANPNYWRKDDFGNQLPYLAEVDVTYIRDKKKELEAFKNNELDMMWGLPVEEIENIMGTLEEAKAGENREFEIQSVNALNIQYYGFRFNSEEFSDINVRKAFNYAVDRDSLVEFILDGEGVPAHNGFVPPLTGYPYETVDGFDYDVEKAQALMAQAGYPKGTGFPELTLYLNENGGGNTRIAEYITTQLKDNIGVNVKLEAMPIPELYPKVEAGELEFWRFGWIADYPNPASFLHLFHSPNVEGASNNYFSYDSDEYDAIYEAALKEIDDEKRNQMYAQADQKIIDDAVVMPIMFNVSIRLINPLVKDFDINEMEYRDLAVVNFIEEKKSSTRVYDNLLDEDGNPIGEEN